MEYNAQQAQKEKNYGTQSATIERYDQPSFLFA
jgi:hypothetical protein